MIVIGGGLIIRGLIVASCVAAAGCDGRLFGGSDGSSSESDWVISQLTLSSDGGGSGIPSLAGSGQLVAFSSSGDLTGENPEYLDELFVQGTDGTGLRQLTHNLDSRGGIYTLQISRDGRRIVFAADGRFEVGANADGEQEIYVVDPDTEGLVQLTDTPATSGWGPALPVISGDGERILFLSVADYACDTCSNPYGDQQIFLVKTDGTGLTQVTHFVQSVIGVESLAASGDLSIIVFHCGCDPLGTNSERSREIFSIRSDGSELRQLTSSFQNSGFPSISTDGSLVAFESYAELVPGSNPSLDAFIYTIKPDGSALTQLPYAGAQLSAGGGISADGATVTFTSDMDLTR